MPSKGEPPDIVVAGAGMAGLVASLRALQEGSKVLTLEKGPRPGGSMRLSNGNIWTFGTVEVIRTEVPSGNDILQSILVEGLSDGLDWLESSLSPRIFTGEPMGLSTAQGRQIDPERFTEEMVVAIKDAGGRILLGSSLEAVDRDADGEISGIVYSPNGRDDCTVSTESVILATGGFQGNEELVERYIVDSADNVWLRANPWSTGDGLLAAQAVNARMTKGWSWFYGHNLPASPASFSMEEFDEVSQKYGPYSIAVDSAGNRYADESISLMEETLTQETARLADGQAYYILDNCLYQEKIRGTRVSDMVEYASAVGGRVTCQSTLDELGEALVSWGVNGQNATSTIREFNKKVKEGRADELIPARTANRKPIDAPPFYAVEVQPGITMTVGGVAVTDQLEVISRSRSASGFDIEIKRPPTDATSTIRGLFAAGADVGNVQGKRYAGGLAIALTTGLVAGKSAARRSSP